MLLAQLLAREGGTEIRIPGPNQIHGSNPTPRLELVVARAPTLARDQARGSVLAQRPAQALDLTKAEAQPLRRAALREPPLQHAAQNLESVQILGAHRQGSHVAHAGRLSRLRLQNPTFLLGRNPTFELGAYTSCVRVGAFCQFQLRESR